MQPVELYPFFPDTPFHCGIYETCQPREWQFSNKKVTLLIGC